MSISYTAKVNKRALGAELLITNEGHTVGISGVSTVTANQTKLKEVPLQETPSSVVIAGYTEVTSTPGNLQFKVDYTTGVITFNSAQNGNSVSVTYKGRGSFINAIDVNEIQTPIGVALNSDGTLSNGIVKPLTISTTGTDDFTFPRDITATRSIVANNTVTTVTLRVTGIINAGSGNHAITTSAGLLDPAKIAGNLLISSFNGGTSASSTTFWRGDGTWATANPSIGSTIGSGSVDGGLLFLSGGGTTLGQDSNLFWDATNNKLSITGVATAGNGLEITGAKSTNTTPFIAVFNNSNAADGNKAIISLDGYYGSIAGNTRIPYAYITGTLVESDYTALEVNTIIGNNVNGDFLSFSGAVNGTLDTLKIGKARTNNHFPTQSVDYQIVFDAVGGQGYLRYAADAQTFTLSTSTGAAISLSDTSVTLNREAYMYAGIRAGYRALFDQDVSALATDYVIAMVLASTSRTVSLPAASVAGQGKILIIKDLAGLSESYPITIDPAGVDTIEGDTSYTIANNYEAVHLMSDGGSSWVVI